MINHIDSTALFPHQGRRYIPTRASAWWRIGVLTFAAITGLSACEKDEGGGAQTVPRCEVAAETASIAAAPYTATQTADPVVRNVDSQDTITVEVPEDSLAMGIVSQGELIGWKAIIHGYSLVEGGEEQYVQDSGGNQAPLCYSMELDGEETGQAVNLQAAAALFPNDGKPATLNAGTWSIPIASVNAAFTEFESDEMTTYVYYKTETSLRPTLKLNVWVVNGVNPEITDDASAAADAEIQGALAVLDNVYELNGSTDIRIDADVRFIGDDRFDVIDTDQEMYELAGSYPDPAVHDAMNIFVVTRIDNLGAGTENVIGLAFGLPGPFTRQGTAVSGTLAEYQSDEEGGQSSGLVGVTLGYILAHEFGHFLGLYHSSQTDGQGESIVAHDPIGDTERCSTADLQSPGEIDNCPDRLNLMFPYLCDPLSDEDCSNPEVSQGQGNVVRYNPGVTP